MEDETRRSSRANDFDTLPEHSPRVARTQGFHRGFLRGEPSGEMDCWFMTSGTVLDFSPGEDAMQEPVTIPLEDRRQAHDIRGVDADTDDVGHRFSSQA